FERIVLRDSDKALKNQELDIFLNAGPNNAHVDPTIVAANAGAHVLSEKPLASTSDEALYLLQSVRQAGVKHMCAYIHRFIPALRLAREMIQAGEIGEVQHFRSQFLLDMREEDGSLTWRFTRELAGGGASGDLASHHIDVARFLAGEVQAICGTTRTWSTGHDDVNDDSFSAIAHLDSGAMATIEASRITPGHALTGRIEVDGTKGTLSFSMERLNELTLTEARKGPRTFGVTSREHPFGPFFLPVGIQGAHPISWRDCFTFQAHHMIDAVQNDKEVGPVAATFVDGYRVAEIVDTALRSSESGRFEDVRFRD
ncbi:MAG: Gfo/Idh/MocA family oxidoreductase, partial [Boseongicola sp.]|nr:Gfo/Idh/MocA family oxidoreductase [Boseongicola sp.]